MQYDKTKVLAILDGHLKNAEAAEAELRKAYEDEKAVALNGARVALHDAAKAHRDLMRLEEIDTEKIGVEGDGGEDNAKVVSRLKRVSDQLHAALAAYEKGIKESEKDTYQSFRNAVGRAYFYGSLKPFLAVASNMDHLRQTLDLLRTSDGDKISTTELENLKLYQFIVKVP